MDELKPCPFCGGTNLLRLYDDVLGSMHYACMDCDASGPSSLRVSDAKRLWNLRKSGQEV